MNRYKFLQAVHIAGADYARGVHEVPEKAEYDDTFLKYVSLGLIVEVGAEVTPPSPSDLQARNKRLHDRLVKQADERRAKARGEKPVAAKAPEPAVEEKTESEEKSDGEKSTKEKKSHGKK